jgi:hypothetical protein
MEIGIGFRLEPGTAFQFYSLDPIIDLLLGPRLYGNSRQPVCQWRSANPDLSSLKHRTQLH